MLTRFDSAPGGVKWLFYLDTRFPMLPAIVGTTSGLSSWVIAHNEAIRDISGCIGAAATAAIAVLSLLRFLYKSAAAICAARRMRRTQLRTWKRHDPADDHLEF
ncbi:MAG TPA: hypothetical protein VGM54_09885 [Chthoniobacter sp.]